MASSILTPVEISVLLWQDDNILEEKARAASWKKYYFYHR